MALKTNRQKTEAPSHGIDFAEDIKPRTDQQSLAGITRLTYEMQKLARDAEYHEEKAKGLREKAREIAEQTLPELMTSLGMEEFKLTTGQVVRVERVVAGSIPKDRLDQALIWLRTFGHDGLIKRNISVALAKGQDKLGEKVRATLEKLGVEVREVETVHPQTLGAWAREMIAAGKKFPQDLLGIYVGRRATVK